MLLVHEFLQANPDGSAHMEVPLLEPEVSREYVGPDRLRDFRSGSLALDCQSRLGPLRNRFMPLGYAPLRFHRWN
jgi:hypothetical protein